MAKTVGLKLIKNTSEKVIHIKLSKKHFPHIIGDLLDRVEMAKHRSEKSIDWNDAKQKLHRIIETKKTNA